jgi:hypothetical protein
MMIKMNGLDRKLKREIVEVCLNCKRFVECDYIGKFEECADFKEVESEAWVIKKIKEAESDSASHKL